MDSNQIDIFLMTNGKYFPPEYLPQIRQQLSQLSQAQVAGVMCMQFKDPTLAMILSVVAGTLGVDRFYIGDIGLGVCKLITGGLCGTWWLIDLFLIMGKTREHNYHSFCQRICFS